MIEENKQTPLQSILGDIFRMHLRGEITAEYYHLANADWVEKNTHKFSVLLLPSSGPAVVEYANGRISGRDFDHNGARKLGEWFLASLKINQDNLGNVEVLRWAQEIMASKNIPCPRIELALRRGHESSTQDEFYLKAVEVKRMDGDLPATRKRA